MPISPEKMKLYPGGSIRSPEWLAIRARIQLRAGNRCEGCGVPNLAFGWRDDEGGFHISVARDESGRMPGRHYFKIVCTTAHFDNQLTDHSDANLRFWCQQCHNRHDALSRAAGRQKA